MSLTQEQTQHVIALGWAPGKTFSVSVTDVWINKDVQVSIGRQLHSLCEAFGLPFCQVRSRIGYELYWHAESDQLGMMIEIKDSHIESMYLQVPSGHWGFKEKGTTQ